MLDLDLCKIGTLVNPLDSWPSHLETDGCVYDRIEPASVAVQLGWLELQDQNLFRAQPFDQLANVLRKMGLEEDVRLVMIAKNEKHARYVRGEPEWLWYGLFGQLIHYGYDPTRTIELGLAVIGIGCVLFRWGYRSNLLTRDKEFSASYPKFNAVAYSLEVFLPLVKLGVGEYWTPNAKCGAPLKIGRVQLGTTGGFLRVYFWFHIIAGWFLTTLWVGLISGIVKA